MKNKQNRIFNNFKKLFGKQKVNGFFDLEPVCNHPEHAIPTHLHIPAGKSYRHVCPGCGKETVAKNNIIY